MSDLDAGTVYLSRPLVRDVVSGTRHPDDALPGVGGEHGGTILVATFVIIATAAALWSRREARKEAGMANPKKTTQQESEKAVSHGLTMPKILSGTLKTAVYGACVVVIFSVAAAVMYTGKAACQLVAGGQLPDVITDANALEGDAPGKPLGLPQDLFKEE